MGANVHFFCVYDKKIIPLHRNVRNMEIVFKQKYLSDLYYKGKSSDKKHRFQPHVVKRYKLRIETLESAERIEDLYPINSLHYEVLKGDKKGISSIRVNDQYRVEFTTQTVENETLITVCNILELSNHYK